MKRFGARLFFVLLYGVLSIPPQTALAGGLYLSEWGTTAMGAASAGREAVAEDAGIALHNPAAMTKLDERAILAGLGMLYLDAEFAVEATTQTGGNGGQAGGPAPLANLSWVEVLTDEARFGFTVYVPMAALFDYEDQWAGRTYIQHQFLLAMSIAPSFAYQVTDWLSLGVGASATYTSMDLYVAAIPPGPVPEGQIRISDARDWTAGFSVSTLVEASDDLRLGLVYTWGEDAHLSGGIEKRGVTNSFGAIDLDLAFAQTLSLGLYYEPNDELGLRASLGWQDWSALENQFVSLSVGGGDISAPIPRNWHDTWFIALGLDYLVAENWTLLGGLRYDSSPVDDELRTPDLAVDRQIRMTSGFQWQATETFEFGATFEYANLGRARIEKPDLVGEYDDYQFWALNLTFSWR